MMISTRGRYALRVLVDLAEHSGGLVPMKDVAARQGISKKYMEQIMALLVRDGYVEGVHGKGGGYRQRPDRHLHIRNLIHHENNPRQKSQAEIIQPRIQPGMKMRYLMACPLAILPELEVGNRDGNPVDNS